MADFKYKVFHGKPNPDDDILASRAEARRLRAYLITNGHEAHVEGQRGARGEYRVWVQHPEHKDLFSYVHRSDKGFEYFVPLWIEK